MNLENSTFPPFKGDCGPWGFLEVLEGRMGKVNQRQEWFLIPADRLRLNDKRLAEMDGDCKLIIGITELSGRQKCPFPSQHQQPVSSFHQKEWGFSANVHEFTWTEFTQIHQCLELAWYLLGIKETKGSHPCTNHRTSHIRDSRWTERTNVCRNLIQKKLCYFKGMKTD